ncbi:MotA/TolQ/ExbB proton channel family protein [Pelagibaculum spongiae]|uniref:Biopolymer transporter ExbB n=1 Tax=Pelagibaculum spongiae TaxID=2080658 RepID=A0A2V1GZR5_9GAMM|nr:MotA/TolQ/ExbB proton channel family protein [Pelagibaculum spongiae]PVZ68892.1 biopolymer transporter ExbB [Pelagibaculum spongiae]
MFEIIKAGGLLMLPIVICSVVALTIIVERFFALRDGQVIPDNLVAKVWLNVQNKEMNEEKLADLRHGSPMGRVLAAGISNLNTSREVMKDAIDEAGRHAVIQLERFLNTLGIIASVSPLLGLLGTVIGMIKVFTAITTVGVGNPAVLADGISQALITTAAGMSVAIPALIAHRYYQRRIDELAITMEQEAVKLVDVIHGDRRKDEPMDHAGGSAESVA